MSKVARRLVLAMLAAAIVPLIFALFLALSLTEVSMGLGINKTVQQGMDQQLHIYRELFAAKRAEYQAQAKSIARDPELVAALSQGELAIRGWMQQQAVPNPDLYALKLVGHDKDLSWTRQSPKPGRPLHLSEAIPGYPAYQLEQQFRLPQHFATGLDEARELAETYQRVAAAKASISHALLVSFAALLGFILIASVLLGLFLARGVTQRVTELARATESLARGDTEVRVAERGDDEITALASAFNSMVDELEQRRDRIVYLEKISGWQEVARRLAHEIKNPLTPIVLAVQQIDEKKPSDDEKYARLVSTAREVIEEEVGSLRRLVEEFSSFAKLPQVQRTNSDIRRFFDELTAHLTAMYPELELHLEPQAALGEIALDRMLMRRVLSNLVLNALQAQKEQASPPQVCIRVTRSEQSLRIEIEDAGPGIDPALQSKVFEPYVTSKSTGTGLGLAIVKKIILQHQGRIFLEAAQKLSGACFVIDLPTDAQADDQT